MNDGIVTLFGRFGLGNQLRHLSLEKFSGISAATLIISLCLFRINGVSIFGAYRQRFKGLLDAGKNCFYRMMFCPSMDWRRLLLSMCNRFLVILRKENAERDDVSRCYILDDSTSTLPVDFSLHREKSKKGDFGLTKQERKKQFRVKRRQSNPDKVRAKECDRSTRYEVRGKLHNANELIAELFRPQR